MKKQLNENIGRGEGSVSGEENMDVVRLLTFGIQKVGDQVLQGACFESAQLHSVVLDIIGGHMVVQRGHVWACHDGLSSQRDAKHSPVLLFVPPFLYLVLSG